MQKYRPLIVLVAVSILAGLVISDTPHEWMPATMGVALVIFASLKLFSPEKFADGFQKYDLIGKPFRSYAFVYPYIELALGIAYLGGIAPLATYIVTIVVFGIGALGVIDALRKGLNTNCACMGNILNVPLSTVTLFEDVAMALMALAMLIMALV